MNVEYTSVWNDELEITTSAKYNEYTREISDIVQVLTDVEGCCTREYITLPDGYEIEVCEKCHEYTKGGAMFEDEFNNLYESIVCHGGCDECE